MTHFIKDGANFHVSPTGAVDIRDHLPAGTYTVKFNPLSGQFFLSNVDNFDIAKKIYGNTNERAARILTTFKDRTSGTGVMLTGDSGSGKTLLAKVIATTAREEFGYPTLLVNEPWNGENFNLFIQSIDQPMVIIFDEFEKVYDAEDQQKMLTLLDGVYPSQKLFILTCNDKYRINQYMRNRPGRLYYRFDYAGLDREFIEEYCADNLTAVEHTQSIVRLSIAFGDFSFDILQALVEEMNRFGESPSEAMKVLNARPEYQESATYKVELHIPGKEKISTSNTWRGNPLNGEFAVYWENPDDEDDEGAARFSVTDLVKLDEQSGRFIFRNSAGQEIKMVKNQISQMDWSAL